jgi:hypothetical protein
MSVKNALLFATAILSAGMMPADAPPAIKMGLWEMTTVVHINMPGTKVPDSTTKARTCYTLETWLKTMKPPASKDCVVSNAGWTGRTYKFDFDCPAQKSKTHSETTYTDATTGHGMLHMEMGTGGQHIVSDASYETHFASADCGSVTPESPQILP